MSQIHIGRNGALLGVFSEEEVRAAIAIGTISPGDLGWRSGMAQWVPIGEWPEFALRNAPPPIFVPVPGEPEIPEPAWERREKLGTWKAFWCSVFGILFSPAKIFSAMPKQSGFGATYIFYLIPAVFFDLVGNLIQLVLQLKYTATCLKYFSDWADNEKISELVDNYLRQQAEIPDAARRVSETIQVASTIIGAILGAAVGVFIITGIVHLLLMLFRGAKYPFITTFKTCAYVVGAFAFIRWIPGLGGLLYLIWGSAVMIIALSKAHEIPVKKAALAVLSPVLFCCCVWAGLIGGGLLLFKNSAQWRYSFPPPRHTTVPATPSPAQPVAPTPDDDSDDE